MCIRDRDLLHTNPIIMPHFIMLSHMVCEKCVTYFFTLLTITAPQGDPLVKFHQSGNGDVQQGPLHQSAKSCSYNPSTRYLLPMFVDFVDGVTKNTLKVNAPDGGWWSSPCDLDQVKVTFNAHIWSRYTHTPNYIEIGKTFSEWTEGRTDGQTSVPHYYIITGRWPENSKRYSLLIPCSD